ncbi:MAG: type II toxin-antitoxin system ParD family antitoxin [Thermomicrobiales bacterium]
MNVSLTPYWEQYVREKVESGRYNNASEVIREALRKLEFVEDVKEFRAFAKEAMDPANRDKLIEWTDTSMDEIVAPVLAGEVSEGPRRKYLYPPEDFNPEDPFGFGDITARQVAEDGGAYQSETEEIIPTSTDKRQ